MMNHHFMLKQALNTLIQMPEKFHEVIDFFSRYSCQNLKPHHIWTQAPRFQNNRGVSPCWNLNFNISSKTASNLLKLVKNLDYNVFCMNMQEILVIFFSVFRNKPSRMQILDIGQIWPKIAKFRQKRPFFGLHRIFQAFTLCFPQSRP